MNNKNKECNYIVELLRFLFCTIIVVHYSYSIVW